MKVKFLYLLFLDSCNSVVTEEQVCPESDIAKAHKASKFCKKLLADPRFTVCHDIMDVAILEDACRADFCNCHLPDPTECACETMSIYVKECQHKGIKSLANWRDENTCRKLYFVTFLPLYIYRI